MCERIAKSVGGHGRVRYFGSSIGWVQQVSTDEAGCKGRWLKGGESGGLQ